MSTRSSGDTQIKPFLKWAGGKSQLLAQIQQHYAPELPEGRIRKYVEPFLGGGAVFLDVMQRFDVPAAYLSDINPELVLAYRVVQRSPYELLECLDNQVRGYLPLDEEGRKAYYYEVRAAYNRQRERIDFAVYSDVWVERAAHMLFLNKTCFNGLYRVNSQGQFNVPFGRYPNPSFVEAENLLRVSQLLQVAELQHGGFTECEHAVDPAAFVYFDPPYRPLSDTAHFTSYSRHRFDDGEQARLAGFYAHLHDKYGAKLVLSNSDPRNIDPDDNFFDSLYRRFTIHRVRANRMINANTDRRGKISELLVTNY